MNGQISSKTYEVRYLPKADIVIDGTADEPDWKKANLLEDFSFPWNDAVAPSTQFRALCDDEFFYFAFTVEDDDLVLVASEDYKDKMDVVKEDRVEILFSCDPGLKRYYCMEIDPFGRTLDHQSTYHRQFGFDWSCPNLCTGATRHAKGYTVEGSIPMATLESLGIVPLDSDEGAIVGVFRAEFSHGPNGETIEDWLAWVDPEVPTPDFHVPSAFGRFRLVR